MPLWGHSSGGNSGSASSDSGSGCTCVCGWEKGDPDYSSGEWPAPERKSGSGCSGANGKGGGKHCRRKGNGCYE